MGGGVILPSGVGGFGETPPEPGGPTGKLECNATDTEESKPVEEDSYETGLKVFCLKPDWGVKCSDRCIDKGVYCVPLAVHPKKADPGYGELFSCNTLPIGFMCGYHYPNGDDCYLPIGAPIVVPTFCSYSGNH